jgi:prepilin-type processing-associated H-X9-DG protein
VIRKAADGVYVPINDGAFAAIDDGHARVLRLSWFRDGLSNTLAFSEKPVGSGMTGSYDPFRDWVFRSWDDGLLTMDQWIDACSQIVPDDTRLDAGGSWMIPGAIYSHFFASAPPGTRIPDCGSTNPNMGIGVFAARSYHPGGVNAAMADGSVRWFSSATHVKTWRSLGTRAGGEVVSQ